MSCGWGGNHKYGVTLAICHRLKFIHLHCNDSRPLEGRGAPILHICKGLHCTLYVLHHDHSYCERSSGSSDELQTQCQVAADPQIKPTDLDCLQKIIFRTKENKQYYLSCPWAHKLSVFDWNERNEAANIPLSAGLWSQTASQQEAFQCWTLSAGFQLPKLCHQDDCVVGHAVEASASDAVHCTRE